MAEKLRRQQQNSFAKICQKFAKNLPILLICRRVRPAGGAAGARRRAARREGRRGGREGRRPGRGRAEGARPPLHRSRRARALCRFRETGARYLLTNVHCGADHGVGAAKTQFLRYAPYDYALPPFSLRRLLRVIEVNWEERTAFELFDLQAG